MALAAGWVAISTLLVLLAGESWVRIYKPQPRVQMVRDPTLRVVDGVPTWDREAGRMNRECAELHPERMRILFFGSSITYGSGLPADRAFAPALEARLNELRPTPGFCVLNFARPGFSFEQKFLSARAEVVRYRPALVMWEDWVEWMDYAVIGDTAYGTHGYRLRPDGFIAIDGVPDALNHFLFLHSRLYDYLALAFGAREPREETADVTAFVRDRLVRVPRLAQSTGARLVMYLAPPLGQPFRDTDVSPPAWHRLLLDFAGRVHVPMVKLQHELVDEDYLKLRLDPCCHFSAEGHRALEPVMERIVLQALDGPPFEPDLASAP